MASKACTCNLPSKNHTLHMRWMQQRPNFTETSQKQAEGSCSDHSKHGVKVGLTRAIYVGCTYSIFGREIVIFTVIYGVYIRFWLTLCVCIIEMTAIQVVSKHCTLRSKLLLLSHSWNKW
jgi:type IV secretory pathway VirB3-like protein